MVSDRTRQFIRQRAKYLCEYWHSPEYLSPDRFTIDHLMPKSIGGSDDSENLALACRRCNERHYNFTKGIDQETQQECLLFNPRQQQWSEHFIWTADGLNIVPKTPIGRATCNRLDLNNDERYDEEDSIRRSRRFWVEGGCQPPGEDARQLE
ncbi:HNH endonuclease signature motif containing protein [Microcoleus sp. herbarium5]|uniref:HNH endonuclease signature motif containing protein n=1 Tax=Microcoleus sp. herbarium5 TaxID=3055434 RepID=UPI002FD529B2